MAGTHGQGGGMVAGARRSGLSALISEWPAEAREEYEERAAILEHEARMGKDRAERAAEHIVRDRWERRLG